MVCWSLEALTFMLHKLKNQLEGRWQKSSEEIEEELGVESKDQETLETKIGN